MMTAVLIIGLELPPEQLAELRQQGYHCTCIKHHPDWVTFADSSHANLLLLRVAQAGDSLWQDLHTLSLVKAVPVLLLSQNLTEQELIQAMNAGVCEFDLASIDYCRLPGLFQLTLARFQHEQALKTELETLKLQLEDRKKIDRAKAILIESRKLSEHEAYHTLRKLAMSRNLSLGEMARNVIAMAELLK